jgi:hypothetical protein
VELGRTVEKYSNTWNHKRAAHHFNSCFIGGNWVVGLLNTLTQGITKEQHITQSLLYRWELGRTVEKTLTCNHKRAAHHSILLYRWKLGRTVEKYPKTKSQKRAAHHSTSAS